MWYLTSHSFFFPFVSKGNVVICLSLPVLVYVSLRPCPPNNSDRATASYSFCIRRQLRRAVLGSLLLRAKVPEQNFSSWTQVVQKALHQMWHFLSPFLHFFKNEDLEGFTHQQAWLILRVEWHLLITKQSLRKVFKPQYPPRPQPLFKERLRR